jgi:hypothetical protein
MVNLLCRANAKRGVLAAVLVFGCLVLPGCGDLTGAKMTRANYDKIQVGMSGGQVTALIGPSREINGKGEVLYRWAPGDKLMTEIVVWNYSPKVVTIVFKDGRVESKSQAGL